MNTLTPDGQSVLDSQGKAYALETAHPMPLPEGIEEGRHMLFWYHSDWISVPLRDATHWLLRTEPPTPKTQEELDRDWFDKWWRDHVTEPGTDASYTWAAVLSALAYARRKQP